MIYCEYTLVEGDVGSSDGTQGLFCPAWVDDGGYFKGADNILIGAVKDENEGNIPGSINRKTAAELETRQVAIHAVTPWQKDNIEEDGHIGRVDMTEAEVRTVVQDWVALKG
jgi:hypothetical protein